jgi:hypothetical protein
MVSLDFGTLGVGEITDPTLGQVAIGNNVPDTSNFEIVCFPVGSSPICGRTIGNGSTFCIRKECTVTSHKKLGNAVPCSGMLFVRNNQDPAFVDPFAEFGQRYGATRHDSFTFLTWKLYGGGEDPRGASRQIGSLFRYHLHPILPTGFE